jgi:hypothetical protein
VWIWVIVVRWQRNRYPSHRKLPEGMCTVQLADNPTTFLTYLLSTKECRWVRKKKEVRRQHQQHIQRLSVLSRVV